MNTLFSALSAAFNFTVPSGSGLESVAAKNKFQAMYGTGSFIGTGDPENLGAPKAFINYILFDESFNLLDFGFDQVDASGAQTLTGPVVSHDQMAVHIQVQKKGYLYIFISNESPNERSVYFDDLKIVRHTYVESVNDYYPFGLTFNSYQRENSVSQDYKFGGKEEQSEVDLGWLDFGARTYMPDIGRFGSIDPHADKFELVTPYNYAFNNPLFFVDPTGKENIIYLIVAGDFSQKKARAIRNEANAILKDLGLETRVQIYDVNKNGKFSEKNLDETDNWAVIGNDRELVAKTASDISGDNQYKGEVNDWKNSNGNDPEVSNQEPGKNAKEKGIVVDDSQKHNVFKKHTVMGSAISLLHGAAHSSSEIERIRGLHPTSGISADGSQLRTDYWKYVLPAGGNFHSILNPELNREFIKGIKERYGMNAAKDNYFKKMVDNSNKNRTKQ